MSTKIYNGFKFADTELTVIHHHIMNWRNELRPLHQHAANVFVAEVAIKIIDDEQIRPGSHAGKTPIMEAMGQLWDRQSEVKKTQKRDPLVDFEFNISLMPFEGQVYGIVYTEQREWERLWMNKPFVQEFAYWNNTDAPEELPEEEWEERGRIWNAIFDSAIMTAPSMAGFNADCTHDTVTPHTDNVVAVLPSFEERVSHRAKNAAAAAACERIRSERGPAKTSYESTYYVMDAMEWLRTDDGKKAIDAEKQRIAGILQPVTRDMLLAAL